MPAWRLLAGRHSGAPRSPLLSPVENALLVLFRVPCVRGIRKNVIFAGAFCETDETDMLRIDHAVIQLGGRTLIDGLDLTVRRGERVCLTGESGCGKTSLLCAIPGFVPLADGRVRVDGLSLAPATVYEVRRRLAYVPQDFRLPAESVAGLMQMLLELRANREVRHARQRLDSLWEQLGLEPELYERKAGGLSGGQRQRILLSLAVLMQRPLLLVDEPTSALDDEGTRRVARLLERLAAKGTAVLAVSHDARFTASFDRLVNLSDKSLRT